VGSSGESIEKAIETALGRANKTLRNLDWFEVKELRGLVEGGKVKAYQVTLEVGFRLEE
jgi:flavin-binding protein dodecin